MRSLWVGMIFFAYLAKQAPGSRADLDARLSVLLAEDPANGRTFVPPPAPPAWLTQCVEPT